MQRRVLGGRRGGGNFHHQVLLGRWHRRRRKPGGALPYRGMDQEEVLTGEEAVKWNREERREGNGEMEVEVQGLCKWLLGKCGHGAAKCEVSSC